MSGLDERPGADQEGSPSVREAATELAQDAFGASVDERAPVREWAKLKPYLSLFDFGARPASKAAWGVRVIAVMLALSVFWSRTTEATRPLLTAKPPLPIPTEEVDDYRFRLPERMRREIFADLATAELAERARAIAANSWNGHLWSREDDRGHYERVAVRAAAARHRVSISQVYLVLDEGIRERWPGPDGKPLPADTPPLNIRLNSW